MKPIYTSRFTVTGSLKVLINSNHHCCPSSASRYTGLYTRHLRSGEKEWLSARMVLKRNRNRIVGRFSFGLGEGVLEGLLIQGRRLVYDWRWGNATGRGFLEASSSGGLTGSWSYKEATQGGGTWDLCTASSQ